MADDMMNFAFSELSLIPPDPPAVRSTCDKCRNFKMSFLLEKVLGDARKLVNRLKLHDDTADNVLRQMEKLNTRVDTMKTFQDNINELQELVQQQPKINLNLGLIPENSQIRELEEENKELRLSLEEHQSTLELIMSKYRDQISRLLGSNHVDWSTYDDQSLQSEEVKEKVDKIYEMGSVMWEAIRDDDSSIYTEHEILTQLRLENKTMRELLQISTGYGNPLPFGDKSTQTDSVMTTSVTSQLQMDSDVESLSSFGMVTSISSVIEVGMKDGEHEDYECAQGLDRSRVLSGYDAVLEQTALESSDEASEGTVTDESDNSILEMSVISCSPKTEAIKTETQTADVLANSSAECETTTVEEIKPSPVLKPEKQSTSGSSPASTPKNVTPTSSPGSSGASKSAGSRPKGVATVKTTPTKSGSPVGRTSSPAGKATSIRIKTTTRQATPTGSKTDRGNLDSNGNTN